MTRRLPNVILGEGSLARSTPLRAVPDLPGLQLHLAEDITGLWTAVQQLTASPEWPPPYWAFAWPGGQGLARYLADRPAEVAGRRVLDLATGSGLCALAAVAAGASTVTAADTDPFAELAVARNLAANPQLDPQLDGAAVRFTGTDLLAGEPPDVDVVLAGDVCYDVDMAAAVLPWLRRAAARGSRVLLGDPGRAYLPRSGLELLASYDVTTTTDLEGVTLCRVAVYSLETALETAP